MESDYIVFLEELEGLRGQISLFRPRADMTERIMQTVRNGRCRQARRRRDMAVPALIAALLALAWWLMRSPHPHYL